MTPTDEQLRDVGRAILAYLRVAPGTADELAIGMVAWEEAHATGIRQRDPDHGRHIQSSALPHNTNLVSVRNRL